MNQAFQNASDTNNLHRRKKMKKLLALLATFTVLTPAISFAHGDKFDMVKDSIAMVYPIFKAGHAADLPNFTGVKGWPDQDKILVKVYLSTNTTVNYSCMMMPDDTMMCSAAP